MNRKSGKGFLFFIIVDREIQAISQNLLYQSISVWFRFEFKVSISIITFAYNFTLVRVVVVDLNAISNANHSTRQLLERFDHF